jgi:hypothetical protein
MDVNGQWVGFGLNDVSPTVVKIKQFLIHKFSYASVLQESLTAGGAAAETYDATTAAVVTRMQAAYGDNSAVNPALVVNGIFSYAWQIRSGYAAPPKITILTWQGTGVDMFDTDSPQPYGAAQYVQRAFPNNVVVQPVGYYPASVDSPWMGQSVDIGVSSAVSLLGGAPPMTAGDPVYPTGPVILFGYSQGAICASHLWRDEILNPEGALHHRVDDVIAACTFGNPNRSPGIANGNLNAEGWDMPPTLDGEVTGGISGPDCLTPEQTPDWWYDYVWLGSDKGATELYTMCPIGLKPWTAEAAPGMVGTSIYNIVQDPTLGDVLSVAKDLGVPKAMVEEIWNGIRFAADQNADHYSYNWQASIEYLTAVVENWVTNYITSGGAVA